MDLNFIKERKRKLSSILEKGKKIKVELILAISIQIIIFSIWQFTAWKIEWFPGKTIQILAPLILTFALGRSLKSLGLKSTKIKRNLIIGAIYGVTIGAVLAIPNLKFIHPPMPRHFLSGTELGYVIGLILINVGGAELFYRGYIQTRLETMGGPIKGMMITAVLTGFDFWEVPIFNFYTVIILSIAIGVLYIKTNSIYSTIAAHASFLTSTIVIMILF